MAVQSYAWEQTLLAMAHEAYSAPAQQSAAAVDTGRLAYDYAWCAQFTARHSHSFYLASAMLPAEKRRAVRALYAFCRVTDDIVDAPDTIDHAVTDMVTASSAQGDALDAWRVSLLAPDTQTHNPIVSAFAHTRHKYNIPWRYADQLIAGVARDHVQKRYATFADLASYAYGVASTVGLMSMHIVGFANDAAIPYAIRLGVALQLTNILRDVAEDWSNGRLYLPQEELDAFGVTEEDIARGVVTSAWRNFMQFQIARARALYAEGMRGIALLAPDGRFAITASAILYRAILAEIEAHDYDNLSHRAHISGRRKLAMLPGIWWQSRKFGAITSA